MKIQRRAVLVSSALASLYLLNPSHAEVVSSTPEAIPAPKTIPSDLMKEIARALPKANALLSMECRIGAKKTRAFGTLLNSESIQAWIAYPMGKGWRLFQVPREISNSKGMDGNFLSEWKTSEGKLKGVYEIRCTSPYADKDIQIQANGEFVGEFAQGVAPEVRHLCFQASQTYNNWACYTMSAVTERPELSFVQLNAD